MRKSVLSAAALAVLSLGFGGGFALAQAGHSHTIVLNDHREAGVTAAVAYLNANAGTSYQSNDEYIQFVMDHAGDSYCNNVPGANCPP